MSEYWEIPDPITFLEGLLPGNPFQGQPPLPRGLLALMEDQAEPRESQAAGPEASKPGCTAADNAGVVLYHLEGLGLEGKPNFGVLRVSRERLEEGASAAELLGRGDLAREMRRIAGQLPHVHDAEAARRLAQDLRPLAYTLWDLGARCKSGLSPAAVRQARALAEEVRAGRTSFQEAVLRMRGAAHA